MKTTSSTLESSPIAQRLQSLDALRGFDMLWIMGAEEIFKFLYKATGSPFWGFISNQLEHPEWNGFTFNDLIFPLFLFMAGVATPYSLGKELEKGKSREQLLQKVIKRGLILVILGIIYNNGLEFKPLEEIRFGSVLGRIGLGYMFANIIFLYTEKQLTQFIWFVGIIIFYYLALKFNAAPGFMAGDLTEAGNFASYLDRTWMPGKLHRGIHDPEGLFSTIPAISTGLLGILTGNFLKNDPSDGTAKTKKMAILGVIFIAIALVWNLDFPINKNLWSSSFVMLVGGISLVLLSIFYYIIDVKGHQKWAFFFRIIGMNSILIYLSGMIIDWEYATDGMFQWLGQMIGDPFNAVALAICYTGIKWTFLYVLYKKNIFLRV
jgi:predicted acyltransferase